MMQALAIATGGAIGALLRFYASSGVYLLLGRGFPYGTLFVNVSGSLLLGVLYAVFQERTEISPEVRLALTIGLLGAFTTFSTFSMETLQLIESGDIFKALLNILLSVVLCLFGAWLGLHIGRQI